MDGMDEIVREFVVESYENLDQLDRDLVALEGDTGSHALLSSVFRTIHTIKGTSGFLGFGALEGVTHLGESLLAELRDGKRAMSQRTADVLLRMVDTVREILAVIESTGQEGEHDTAAVTTAIQAVLDGAEPEPDEEPEAGGMPAAEPPAADAGVAGDARDAVALAPSIPAPLEAPAPSSVTANAPDEAPVRSAAESSIRVDVEVLDALMRHVGELVLARNAMTRIASESEDPALLHATQRLALIASELQQGVMKTRMQPIDNVWSKVPRMVRDISASLGRQVRLEMVGKDTELDRGVLEAIKDPLTHLIRNAIDHGIEPPEARIAAGKPEHGVLSLRAYHQGGQVVIEISDDGKGIDPRAIAEKAVERGLRTAAEVAELGPQDAFQLLFLPGFSTAEKVTHVSGRGVGMDVVKTKVDAIGGVVDVHSVPGTGTTWRLRIPLTLAIMPALTVECASETYAIPQINMLELLAIDDKQSGVEYVGEAPVFRLRGRLLPLVDLRDVLGRPPRETLVGAVIAVMHADGGRFGLLIDQVLNTEEIVAKPISAAIKGIGLYAGATLLGDGSVALILDIPAVARRVLELQETAADEARATSGGAGATEQMLIVSIGEDKQVALPMGQVTRLERFPIDVLERVGGALVMQYRGRITPVVDLAHVLGAGTTFRPELAVVVCQRGDRTVALVADQVVDIVDAQVADRSEVSGFQLLGSIVVRGRVTELLDLEATVAAADASFYDLSEADLVGAGSEH